MFSVNINAAPSCPITASAPALRGHVLVVSSIIHVLMNDLFKGSKTYVQMPVKNGV